jgi:hypothetical protein
VRRRGKRRHKKDKVRMKGGGGAGTISFWTIFNTVSYCTLFFREKHTADNVTWRPLDVLISCKLLLITRKQKSLLFAVRGTAVYIHINIGRYFLACFKKAIQNNSSVNILVYQNTLKHMQIYISELVQVYTADFCTGF